MYYQVDKELLRSLFIRFGTLTNLSEKTEDQYRSIIKLGSIIIFVNEWYDIHNENRKFITMYRRALEVLEASFGITIHDVPKIVSDTEKLFIMEGS